MSLHIEKATRKPA